MLIVVQKPWALLAMTSGKTSVVVISWHTNGCLGNGGDNNEF